MGMPASSQPPRGYTLHEFERIRGVAQAGPRYEFLGGDILVTPSPDLVHQRIVLHLATVIGPFVRTNRLGELVISPFDVRFSNDVVFQPDLLVMTPADVQSGRLDAARELLLAVEVVSPGSGRLDRVRKRPTYQKERVDELWLIDPESELAERWKPDDERPEILTDTLVWSPRCGSASQSIELAELFADAKR